MDIRECKKLSTLLCFAIDENKGAADKEKTTEIRRLIRSGARVNFQNDIWDYETPLHLGVRSGNIEVIDILLEHGADLTLENKEHKTPVDIAKEIGDVTIYNLLQKRSTCNVEVINKISYEKIHFIHINSTDDHIKKLNINNKSSILKITGCNSADEVVQLLKNETFQHQFNKSLNCFVILFEMHNENHIHFNMDILKGTKMAKVMIIQVKSLTTNETQTFYKEFHSTDYRKVLLENRIDIATEIFTHSWDCDLSFSVLINFIGPGMDLLEIELDKDKMLFKDKSLLYYAAKSKNILCLRFLTLFNWNLYEDILSTDNPFYTSLAFGTEQNLMALFHLPLDVEKLAFNLIEEQLKLLRMKDNLGYNFIMIAAQYGNINILDFLIKCGLDVNEKANDKRLPSDIAWENGNYEFLLEMLKFDAMFPRRFDVNKINDIKIRRDFENFLQDRKEFHEAIKNDQMEKIEKFMDENSHIKFGFDSLNYSTLKIAYIEKKLNIIAYLRSRLFAFGPAETPSIIGNYLGKTEKVSLRKEISKYFRNPDDTHILQLIAFSKISCDTDDKQKSFKLIKGFFEELDEIEEIRPILKTIANAKTADIVFDFKHQSVHDVDPTASAKTMGNSYFLSGHIHIGANRERFDILGTLAHELTHYAMQLLYENCCKPYHSYEIERADEFSTIVKKYEEKEFYSKEAIIEKVYTCYVNENARTPELIVRVPHILAQYKNNAEKIHGIKNQFKELFDYFENNTLIDLTGAHKNMKDITAIREINDLLGVYEKLEKDKIGKMSCKTHKQIEFGRKILLIKSNVPLLALRNIHEQLTKTEKSGVKSSNIFIALDQLENKKYQKIHEQIFNLKMKPTIYIVDLLLNDIIDSRSIKKVTQKFLEECNITIIVNQRIHEDKLFDVNIEKFEMEIKFTWSDLSAESQKDILESLIEFKRQKLPLKNFVQANSEILLEMPLDEIIHHTKIFANMKEKEIKTNLMTSVYIKRTFQLMLEDEEQADILDETSLIERADQLKTIILSDIAGMGKTTTIVQIKEQLLEKYPYHLISLIDLKQYTDKFISKLQESEEFDDVTMREYLEQILSIKERFDKKLFVKFLNEEKVILLFDGFDEIDENNRKFVLKLMKAFTSSQKNQLWIASRPHYATEIQAALSKRIFRLKPFTEKNQIDFLVRFWSSGIESSVERNLHERAKELIRQFSETTNFEKLKDFIGIPLQIRMLGEIFNSNEDQSQVTKTLKESLIYEGKINLYKFYQFFINKLMAILNIKAPIAFNETISFAEREKNIHEHHQFHALIQTFGYKTIERLAMMVEYPELPSVEVAPKPKNTSTSVLSKVTNLFTNNEKTTENVQTPTIEHDPKFDDAVQHLLPRYNIAKNLNLNVLKDDLIVTFGILQKTAASCHYQFAHKTFMEYFIAEYLLINIRGKQNFRGHDGILLLLFHVLNDESCDIIRTFLNGALNDEEFRNILYSKELASALYALQTVPEDIVRRERILHNMIKENTKNLMIIVMESAFNDKILLKKMVVSEYKGRTFIHFASAEGEDEIFRILWTYIDKTFNKRERRIFLTFEDVFFHQNVLLCAVENRNFKTFEKVLNVHRDFFIGKQFKALLCYEDWYGRSLLKHSARECQNVESFEKIWQIYFDNVPLDDMKRMLRNNDKPFNILTMAAHNKTANVYQAWQRRLEECFCEIDAFKSLFFYKNGQPRLHETFLFINSVNCEKFWETFCKLFDEKSRKIELIRKDSEKRNILQAIARNDDHKSVEFLFIKVSEMIGQTFVNRFILESDDDGNNFSHKTVQCESEKVFVYVWNFMLENLDETDCEILFTTKNNQNETCFDLAIKTNSIHRKLMVKEAKRFYTDHLKTFVLHKNIDNRTILHDAAECGIGGTFSAIWRIFEELFDETTLQTHFWDKDSNKQNVLFYATLNKTSTKAFQECLKILLKWYDKNFILDLFMIEYLDITKVLLDRANKRKQEKFCTAMNGILSDEEIKKIGIVKK